MKNPAPAPIRVASLPAGHPYVRNLGWDGDGVERIADPMNEDGRWWPPRMLVPDWPERHAADFDLFHFHFGFDGHDPGALDEYCRTLERLGKPIVYTVHDLENPHHADQSLHREQIGTLIERATALITLTGRARDQIRREFGREATVVPHPHIFPLDSLPVHRDRDPESPLVVGLHYKSLRQNMIGLPMLDAILAAADEHGDRLVLRVDVHREVWEAHRSPGSNALRGRLKLLDLAGRVDLRVHDYFDDDEFQGYIGEIDVSVLPYAFGTHSGWLEACRDLGTAVIAPAVGCYSDQGLVFEYELAGRAPDPASVGAALGRATRAISSFRVDPLGPRFRATQRKRIGDAHREVYETVLRVPQLEGTLT